jgi:hypothetical protein
MRTTAWASVLTIVLAGCGQYQGAPAQPVAPPAATPAPAAVPVAPPAAAAAAPAPKPAAAATPMVREQAGVGSTGRGGYGLGIVTTPMSAYFSVQEKLTFEVQLKGAMDIYKATHGHAPTSEADYMRDVVGPIRLPPLPEGHRYVYDPDKETLMVEHPKNK